MPIAGAKIDRQAKLMADFINKGITAWNKKRVRDGKPALKLWVIISKNRIDRARHATDQAKLVVGNKSWTCNSSHMTNSARHVYVTFNGKSNIVWNIDRLKSRIGSNEYAFLISLYAMGMNRAGLYNFKGSRGFLPNSKDPYHVELPQSRMEKADPQITRCFAEYARLTRIDGKTRNTEFEKIRAFRKFIVDFEARLKTSMP